MKIATIGIDLAKEVFQIHGVDERGKVQVRKQIRRKDMVKYFANLEPRLIGMEACGGAHYWARKLEGYGHTVKLMAPQLMFVDWVAESPWNTQTTFNSLQKEFKIARCSA